VPFDFIRLGLWNSDGGIESMKRCRKGFILSIRHTNDSYLVSVDDFSFSVEAHVSHKVTS
jgi:hypothetical protein